MHERQYEGSISEKYKNIRTEDIIEEESAGVMGFLANRVLRAVNKEDGFFCEEFLWKLGTYHTSLNSFDMCDLQLLRTVAL